VAIIEKLGYSKSWEMIFTAFPTWEEIFSIIGDDWSLIL